MRSRNELYDILVDELRIDKAKATEILDNAFTPSKTMEATTKIVLEKKSPKTDDIIKWLRERDMTKYIGVIYSGVCSITFDTEKLIKDITEMMGDE